MKPLGKAIFWIIILIFVFSSALAYSSFSFSSQNIGKDNRVVVSPEEKQAAQDAKIAQTLGQGMEGMVKKFTEEEKIKKEASYYLEVDGVVLTFLEAGTGINLDGYVDKNVKVWGSLSQTTQEKQMIMKVAKIDLRS